MKMSDKCHNINYNSDNPLTSRRIDGSEIIVSYCLSIPCTGPGQ